MYLNEDYDRKRLEEILGNPLPKLDPEYIEAAKIWSKNDEHVLVTQYFISYVFNKDELKIVSALPGNAKEVSEKTGFDERYCDSVLKRLYRAGKILPGKKYHHESVGTYQPILDRSTFNDYLTFAYFRDRKDMAQEREMFLLCDLYNTVGTLSSDPDGTRLFNGFGTRIMPKYKSIKDLPGVMPCENMKEVFYENLANNTLAWMQCPCRAHKTLQRTGSSMPSTGNTCHELQEYDNATGHCLWFSSVRTKFMVEQFDAHLATDKEDADRCLNEIEDALTIYTVKNSRVVGNCCVCCPDCCDVLEGVMQGYDSYQPSRFRPAVNIDKCVGCKICETRCIFKAITYDANGKCIINPDKCKGCGNCVLKCPTKALKMETIHDTDWIPDLKDNVK